MSSLIINFPDCAKLGSHDPGDRTPGEQDTITVWTEDCPVPPVIEAPPPLVPWWAWLLGALLMVAFIVSTAVVRYRRHERLEVERKATLAAQVDMAKARKSCPMCNYDFKPTVKS